MTVEVKVPDIGDFTDVPVITVLVSVGDTIAEEDPLVELESDKATLEVPSTTSGIVTEIKVSEGDTVSEGSLLLIIEPVTASSAAPKSEDTAASAPVPQTSPVDVAMPKETPVPVTDAGFSKVHASPSVRAFARQLDVDLNTVNGSGRKGRILREDVTKYLKVWDTVVSFDKVSRITHSSE